MNPEQPQPQAPPPTQPSPAPAPPQPQPAAPQAPPVAGQAAPTPATGPAPAAQPAGKSSTNVNTNSTQNNMQIAEIRDGIVIMNDGSFRAVMACQSVNFDLMSPQEREAVEFSYQGFLNSLYFPIQVFIRSQKVDLRPYIQKLDKIKNEHDNMLLALLMEDYIGYMTDISTQTNIMDKRFYVVIPFFQAVDAQKAVKETKNFFTNIFGRKELEVTVTEQDLETGKNELKNRIQAVMGGLQQCGVRSIPLDTQELIELYYDAYNPDTATRQKLRTFKDMDAPVISKGKGMAAQPHLDREML